MLTLTRGPWRAQDEYKDAPGSVITADFYGSNQLMPLSDEQVREWEEEGTRHWGSNQLMPLSDEQVRQGEEEGRRGPRAAGCSRRRSATSA